MPQRVIGRLPLDLIAQFRYSALADGGQEVFDRLGNVLFLCVVCRCVFSMRNSVIFTCGHLLCLDCHRRNQ